MFRYSKYAAAAVVATQLAGCAGGPTIPATPPGPAPGPTSITADQLVGSWGLAAYLRDSDKPRTEAEARRQCSNPYVIKPGPNGGVIMHLADNAQPQELVLKGTAKGVTYIGPPGPPAGPEDREITAISDKSFTVKWVNPENSSRFGTMIYIRCS